MVARVTPAGIEGNPGGLAVVWAEENSRDALFAAMRRREVYATSGTRPILRFFAGQRAELHCGDADFVATAYRGGVPMGGEIGPVRGERSPRFGVLAFRDPGTAGAPGAPLQQRADRQGLGRCGRRSRTRRSSTSPATPTTAPASIPATCTPSGAGFDSLCAVWDDPEFDAVAARLLLRPRAREPDLPLEHLPLQQPGHRLQHPASVPAEFAECCNPAVPKTIQERAWSSPIWYRPEGLARVQRPSSRSASSRSTTSCS